VNDSILIQQVNNAQGGKMLALTFARHAEYCAQHGFDYRVQIGQVTYMDERDPWNKIRLAQEACITGYLYIVWLDLDTLITDMDADLREACVMPMNLVHWDFPLPHLQGGAIYWNDTGLINKDFPQAYSILSSIMEEKKYYLQRFPTIRGWYEQGQINEMVDSKRYTDYIGEIDVKWNWSPHYSPPCEKPIVKGWHGYPFADSLEEMKRCLG
jgi:hypothetical protein